MNKLFSFPIVLMFFGLNTWALTDCGLGLDINNISFPSAGTSQTFTANVTLTRTNTTGQCKNFNVGFSTGSSGNYMRRAYSGSKYVSYNLYKDNITNVSLKSLADNSNKNELIKIKFKKKSDISKSVTFEARLPVPNDGRSILAKGNYIDTIQATVESKNGQAQSVAKNFQVGLNILPEINISLASPSTPFDPTSTSYTLEFVPIVEGDSRQVDLKVRSNAGYTVSIESFNGGYLKHKENGTFTIPYQFTVENGTPRSFGGANIPITLGSSSGVTPVDGVKFGLSFIIGSPAGKMAGEYEDTITVVATSTD